MNNRLQRIEIEKLLNPATVVAAFFILITFDALYIHKAHYLVLSSIRYVILCLCLLTLFFSTRLLATDRPTITTSVIFVSTHTALLLYGLSLSYYFGGWQYFLAHPVLLSYLLISMAFGVALLHAMTAQDSAKNRSYLNITITSYIFLAFVFLVLTQAISFAPLPEFHFDTFGEGDPRTYSQPTTALFGLASILFFLQSHQRAFWLQLFWLLAAFFCLYLSMAAGARGEFGATVLVLLLVAIRKPLLTHYSLIVLFLCAIGIYLIQTGLWQEISILERFFYLIETQSFGERDRFIYESVNLLKEQPICLLSGCGLNYFQNHYGNTFGLYPHNSIIELIISYGAIIGTGLAFLTLKGIWKAYRSEQGKESFIFYFALYLFIISLKSGSLVSVTTLPVMLVFAFVACHKPIKSL